MNNSNGDNLIVARATPSLDLSNSLNMSEEFAKLLESLALHYRLNSSTMLPKVIEVDLRQEGWDIQLWVRCFGVSHEQQRK